MMGEKFNFHTCKLSTSMETNSIEQLRKYGTIEVNDFSLQTMERTIIGILLKKLQ